MDIKIYSPKLRHIRTLSSSWFECDMKHNEEGEYIKVEQVQELLRLLQNCSNCKHSISKSEIGLVELTLCKTCNSFSNWEVIWNIQ